jgi:two-component system C4-dicarboxylate transport sensor histidine kinase DctB
VNRPGWSRLTPLLLLLIGLSITAAIGYYLSWQNGLDTLARQNRQQLEQFIGHIESQLARFEFLPELIARNNLLIDALNDPDNRGRLDIVNHYLEDINRITGASDTYLMDDQGTTLAASNWQSDTPFVGSNFSFRPYFSEAMQGRLGRYFALGTTSNKRGYYFAYPLKHAARVTGVLVIKMDLSNIEQRWAGRDTRFIVTDPHGIIFITTHQPWLYKTIRPINDATRNSILQSRQYGDEPIGQLELNPRSTNSGTHLVMQLSTDGEARKTNYLADQRTLSEPGWTVTILSPLTSIQQASLVALLMVVLSGALLLLIGYLLWQRHRRRQEQERFNREAQRKLEQQVQIRTADLRNEIEEHKRTEQTLRDTQDELIQTAKLAVLGEMSASISHELNNPLAAIRSYADNGRKFLQIGQSQEADDNLERITSLTERMAKISAQLKFFARKSSGNLKSVVIEYVIQSAIDITRPRHRKMVSSIRTGGVTPGLAVRADHVQLEQVLVNLINNAALALEAQDDAYIEISTRQHSSAIQIIVEDNGPGIEHHHLERIFDPFFTTRESGLGLGLSISSRIIESMNGTMQVENRPQRGARFIITLPAVEPQHD